MVIATYADCPRCRDHFLCVVQHGDRVIIFKPVTSFESTLLFVRRRSAGGTTLLALVSERSFSRLNAVLVLFSFQNRSSAR